MKKRTANLIVICILIVASANAQITTPRPSPAGSVSSTVGLTDISIDYFRPKKKGRMIFGSGDDYLVKYGEMWRTGANSGSKITLSTDAKIGGENVEAGAYLILSIPGKDEWRFILYSDLSMGGNVSAFKKENEVINVSAKPMTVANSVEVLTFQISDISADNTSANIELTWDNVSVKVPVEVAFDEIVMESIAKNTVVNPSNYTAAANYYLETGKDLEQALKWMDMYLETGKNSAQFWHVHTKARILAAMGKKKEAIATAEDSMAKAKAREGGDFGYIKRNMDLISSLK